MRFFRRRVGKNTLTLQGDVATSTRSMYQGHKELPRIQLAFDVRGSDPVSGEHLDHIEIELDVYEATKFANQLLVTLGAALPQKPRGPLRVPFE